MRDVPVYIYKPYGSSSITWDAGENCIGLTVYQCRVYCVSLAITQPLLGSLSCVSSVDELCTFDVQALQ